VRAAFVESLAAVADALDVRGGPRADLLARVAAAPVAPAVFGVYTELVEAIYAEDLDATADLSKQLFAPGFGSAAEQRIVNLSDDDLGAGQADRYRRLVDEDQEYGAALRAVDRMQIEPAAARVREGLALLDQAEPELAGEVRALIREVVLVETPADGIFNGASSFHLWGALFLNPAAHPTRIEMCEVLAHESGHAILFGMSLGEQLVKNEATARYASPLRSDPRPMDGVVHATYVLARMYYTMTRLLASKLLTDEERTLATARREQHGQGFEDGLVSLDANAEWTPEGAAAFAAARGYMHETARS
jgi:HEXXH motif-containing protein